MDNKSVEMRRIQVKTNKVERLLASGQFAECPFLARFEMILDSMLLYGESKPGSKIRKQLEAKIGGRGETVY